MKLLSGYVPCLGQRRKFPDRSLMPVNAGRSVAAGVLVATLVLRGAGAAVRAESRARRQRRPESGVDDPSRVTGLTP